MYIFWTTYSCTANITITTIIRVIFLYEFHHSLWIFAMWLGWKNLRSWLRCPLIRQCCMSEHCTQHPRSKGVKLQAISYYKSPFLSIFGTFFMTACIKKLSKWSGQHKLQNPNVFRNCKRWKYLRSPVLIRWLETMEQSDHHFHSHNL